MEELNNMNYFIGIDGGGTSTSVLIQNNRGELLSRAYCGCSNVNVIDKDEISNDIGCCIKNELISKGLRKDKCLALCMGMAGAGNEKNKKIYSDIIKSTGISGRIIITNDAHIALRGAVGENGIILISGTGSICYGASGKKSKRIGGWGHLLGDEGSGYAVGIKIIKRIVLEYEGKGEKTVLRDCVFDALGINDLDGLISFVYDSKTTKREIAALAKCCCECAKHDDHSAIEILEEAAGDLSEMVKKVYSSLFAQSKCELAYSGGLIENCDYLYEILGEKIRGISKKITVVEKKYDPVIGAILLAQDLNKSEDLDV